MKTSTDPRTQRTPLQQHVGFFDRNKDGMVYPWETYSGFRALGFNMFIAITTAFFFHVVHTGYWTQESWIPNLLFPANLKNIHWAKHGSDTESYDTKGRFNEQKYEENFKRYDRGDKGGLNLSDMCTMIKGNRNVLDIVGWSFQFFLWLYLWCLAADPVTGIVSKDDIIRLYDGRLFYEIESRIKKGERLPWYRGGAIFC
jgi:peroxygenase